MSAGGASRGDDRKHQILSRHQASSSGIADAVVAKGGEPFFLCRPDGQVPIDGGHGYGFYHHDCRYLAGYELVVAGNRLLSLAATEPSAGRILLELTNPAFEIGDGSVDKDQLGLTWTRVVEPAGPVLRDRLVIRNFGTQALSLPVRFRFRGGFEDVFQIRGLLPAERGTLHDPAWIDGDLVCRYAGLDRMNRSTTIRIDPSPTSRMPDGAEVVLEVAGRSSAHIDVTARIAEELVDGAEPIERRTSPGPAAPSDASGGGESGRGDAGRRRSEASDRTGEPWIGGGDWSLAMRTSSLALGAAIGRSLDDLSQLRGTLDGFSYYAAGIPWFSTLFGRDSLIAALQSLPWNPTVAAETLRLLARRQGTKVDDWRDEAPGRILHELRIGELARIGEIPQTPYYGTVDATPLFLILLARHAAWTGSLDLYDELQPSVAAALGWLDGFADGDGGFIEYDSDNGQRGLANQGWKDSGNAIVKADGSLAEPPIALVEVQGYAWRAWTEIAELSERRGDRDLATRLRASAEQLRARFEERFWSEQLGCYAMALAPDGRCDVISSNAGQALWSGLPSGDRAAAVADRLMQPDMFNGWGIRTLSADAAAYHPIGYHLGTVWPHDNSFILDGFRRYGHDDAAERLFLGLLEAGRRLPEGRLPECFAGFDRDRFRVPVRYPVACHPQAWAAGALPAGLLSLLGLEPAGFDRSLIVRRPRLPAGIEELEIRGIPIADATVHLRFCRSSDATDVEVVAVDGEVDVKLESDVPPHRATSGE